MKVSKDTRVLDWILQAAQFLNPKVYFVAGYQIDEIVTRYPELDYTVNPDWRNTGPVASLLEANVNFDSEADYVVSYGDIVFREKTVRQLIDLEADVGIAVDSSWRHRYLNRTADDLNRSEKVQTSDKSMLDSGSSITVEQANAEFIGLMKLKPHVLRFLKDKSETFLPEMRKAPLTGLFDFLKANKFNIEIVDVEGDWAELNEPHDLASFILGTKAQSLRRLEKVITLSKIAPQVSFTVDEWHTEPAKIVSNIQAKFQSKKIIVRSSALSEDGFQTSNAGAYESILDINSNVKENVVDAIDAVVESYVDRNTANQVLVQPMIEDVSVSGVVFTRTLSENSPYYVINFDDSSSGTDTITSGSSKDHKTLVVLRESGMESSDGIPEQLHGLLPAITEIENLLNFQSLDIEFAIGREGMVHILQVRPLTSSKYDLEDDSIVLESVEQSIKKFRHLQNKTPFVVGETAVFGVMPDWNPAEIIGTKPNSLSFDIYRYLITDEVWATQRAEYGYRDVRPHPLLVSFSGHPYVDVRASFNSFIPTGIDEQLAGRLVDYYLAKLIKNPEYHDKVEFEIVPTCYGFDFEDWKEDLVGGGFSVAEIKKLEEGLKHITNNGISRTEFDFQTVESFKHRFDQLMASDLPALDKALSLLQDCQQYGTLVFAHLARSAFVSVTILKSAVKKNVITQDAMDSFMNSIETVAHEFVNDAKLVAENRKSWRDFVERYGHLRPGTYDITSEAYSDNEEKYLRPVVDNAKNSSREDPEVIAAGWYRERDQFFSSLASIGIIGAPETIESFLRQSIEGREYAKFIFSRNLSAALDLIREYGESLGLTRQQLAFTSLGSFFRLRAGAIGQEEARDWLLTESENCQNSFSKTEKVELPPLIVAEKDFKAFMYPNSQPNYVGSGRVSAKVERLSNQALADNSMDLEGKILLIPQADPGFDWIFGHNIAGLVTMYGGGNSHMAIRAKEFGLPAAIGVGESLYRILSSASIVELDVGNRKLSVIT